MSFYPDTPISLEQIWKSSFKHYVLIFRFTFFYIVLFAIVKNLYLYLGGMPQNVWLKSGVIVLISLALIYLWTSSLASTAAALRDDFLNLRTTARSIHARIVPIYLSCLGYVALFFIVLYLGKGIIIALQWSLGNQAWLKGVGFIIFCGFPLLVAFALSFYALPLVIVEGQKPWDAFLESSRLVSPHWLHGFMAYVVLATIILLESPDTLHWHFLSAYNLTIPFDMLVLSVLIPLFNALVLLSLNDLQLRGRGGA